MTFKISIVTATLNRAEFLPRCIESVAAQSHPDKEHIVIDGGSTDGTVELLTDYARRYPHLRFISEKDNGLSQAFNRGLALATGDVIGVIGDDDFYQPGALEVVAQEFACHPEAGLVSGSCAHSRNDGSIWLTQQASFSSRRDLIEWWRYWGNAVVIPAPSTFIRRRVIEAVGGFEEADRYAMDYHHWIKSTEKFRVTTVDRLFATFRNDEGTISFSRNRQQQAEMLAISKRYWGSPLGPDFYRFLFSYWRYYKCRDLRGRVKRKLRRVLAFRR